ncbi:MAG TPA: TauD/TfdA family dioxygenase [Candidatus Sulfotelmatobacter sp.]|nr:TauD/TfdA family dioxygenase [Candidatus Sulfotelmatobacter sp.]
MALTITKLHPLFGAEIGGVDTGRPMDDAMFGAIRAALDDYSLLVFHDQTLDDGSQVAFSERFGPLEKTISANAAGGTHFARQSNIDIDTGAVIPPEDRRMIYQKGNMLWHTDSSFKPVPSLCSLLSARVVPAAGGDTDFASARAAYDALPDATKARIEGLVAEHSLAYSRGLIGPDVLTEAQKNEVPPVRQAVVRANPANGRKAIYAGSHASHIVGWPAEEGRALLRELNDFITQPRFCYTFRWRAGDLVIWDNRCLLHRATPYDGTRYKRLMQRTTVAGDGPTA